MQAASLKALLETHLPTAAVDYCHQLWIDAPFHLVLRKSRTTKLGDFSCRPGRQPRITINADSSPYVFLLTYLHEVAHLHVHGRLGFSVSPHGEEWKQAFRDLCAPLFQLNIFPPLLAEAVRSHLQNPPASSFSDAALIRQLNALDHRTVNGLLLIDIPEGSEFQLHGRWYKKGKHRRTRILCKELTSRRNYLISAHAPIVR